MLSKKKNTLLFLKRLQKKKIIISHPGNFPPIPQFQTICKNYFLKTSANSVTEYLIFIIDLYKEVKQSVKNSNKRKKEEIHLKNLAKQLELYKQNPARGGNGGGRG